VHLIHKIENSGQNNIVQDTGQYKTILEIDMTIIIFIFENKMGIFIIVLWRKNCHVFTKSLVFILFLATYFVQSHNQFLNQSTTKMF
jgi:hypothetical protein